MAHVLVSHTFRYRLADVVGGQCVLRYDNEPGKGGHRHAQGIETPMSSRPRNA